MPVEFRLTKLAISGFRGIRELEVDLPAGKPLYLVGGNNAGKTTLLEAAALALGGFTSSNLASSTSSTTARARPSRVSL